MSEAIQANLCAHCPYADGENVTVNVTVPPNDTTIDKIANSVYQREATLTLNDGRICKILRDGRTAAEIAAAIDSCDNYESSPLPFSERLSRFLGAQGTCGAVVSPRIRNS